MAEAIAELEPLVLHTAPAVEFDDDQLFRLCQQNQELRIERDAQGNLIIMAPECGSSGRGGAQLLSLVNDWAMRDGRGEVFGFSTGFFLPNTAMRAPDVSWVLKEKLDRLTDEQWNKFLPLCPDFVLELRSPSDSLRSLQKKLEEYVRNGASLGWLIDPRVHSVHIYRPGVPPEVLVNPSRISGDPTLPGFVLELADVWAVIERRRKPSEAT